MRVGEHKNSKQRSFPNIHSPRKTNKKRCSFHFPCVVRSMDESVLTHLSVTVSLILPCSCITSLREQSTRRWFWGSISRSAFCPSGPRI